MDDQGVINYAWNNFTKDFSHGTRRRLCVGYNKAPSSDQKMDSIFSRGHVGLNGSILYVGKTFSFSSDL